MAGILPGNISALKLDAVQRTVVLLLPIKEECFFSLANFFCTPNEV